MPMSSFRCPRHHLVEQNATVVKRVKLRVREAIQELCSAPPFLLGNSCLQTVSVSQVTGPCEAD